ncbi:ATP-binding cassette domain-containing protein [Actinomadura sp. OS1-43]|nr:ATP-binding cassette domain-containing protein [Actinomadura sp. OS1-43]MDL4817206.1 ATP-binding cassette domain-containing protein [Actinomadura sp. OS1-43]
MDLGGVPGVVGKNDAGKSTLPGLLAGLQRPAEGDVGVLGACRMTAPRWA